MRSKFYLSALIFSVAWFAIGCSKKSPVEKTGEGLFKGYGCDTCHRIGNHGGTLGPDLSYIGFRKTPEWLDLWLQNPSAWKHNTSMPNFYLREPQRKQLVEYLSSLKGQAYKDVQPWNDASVKDNPVKRGEILYKSLGCAGCHGIEGKGGYPNNNVVGGKIPALIAVAAGYSKEELKTKIRDGVRHPVKADAAGPDPLIFMPEWDQVLKDDEVDSLVEYLYSLAPQSATEQW